MNELMWRILMVSQLSTSGHKRPIGAHFHSGGAKFSYLSQDLEESLGEPEETIARKTVWETTAEHLHDVLNGDQGVDETIEACP